MDDDDIPQGTDRVALGMFLRLRRAPAASGHLGRALVKVNDGDLAAVLGHLLVRIDQLEHRLATGEDRP